MISRPMIRRFAQAVCVTVAMAAFPSSSHAAFIIETCLFGIGMIPPGCTVVHPGCLISCANPGHPSSNDTYFSTLSPVQDNTDNGGWVYDNNQNDSGYGTVAINCRHPDSRMSQWVAE